MMTVDVSNGSLDIKFESWDRFWCLKKHMTIPLAHIKSVQVAPPPPRNWKEIKAPGSYWPFWPGKITAGSFWSWETHEWSFWNIRKAQRVVVIDLEGEKYSRLVLEVGDPEEVRDQVQDARMEKAL
jgi:hypothetical protein